MIQFRDAHYADFKAIALLHARNWQENYRGIMNAHYLEHEVVEDRLQNWEKRLQDPEEGQKVIIAENTAGQFLGFVCSYLNQDSQWGSYLDNLHVSKSQRGQGIGLQLMQQTALWLQRTQEDKRLYLWVFDQNEGAKRFYKKLGGAIVEKTAKNYQGSGASPVVRIYWPDSDNLLQSH